MAILMAAAGGEGGRSWRKDMLVELPLNVGASEGGRGPHGPKRAGSEATPAKSPTPLLLTFMQEEGPACLTVPVCCRRRRKWELLLFMCSGWTGKYASRALVSARRSASQPTIPFSPRNPTRKSRSTRTACRRPTVLASSTVPTEHQPVGPACLLGRLPSLRRRGPPSGTRSRPSVKPRRPLKPRRPPRERERGEMPSESS